VVLNVMQLMTKVDFIRKLINMQVKADTNGLRNLQLNKPPYTISWTSFRPNGV